MNFCMFVYLYGEYCNSNLIKMSSSRFCSDFRAFFLLFLVWFSEIEVELNFSIMAVIWEISKDFWWKLHLRSIQLQILHNHARYHSACVLGNQKWIIYCVFLMTSYYFYMMTFGSCFGCQSLYDFLSANSRRIFVWFLRFFWFWKVTVFFFTRNTYKINP